MRLRRFFAILAAVAMLLAPAFTSAGMAQAAVADHHTPMEEKGHCDSAKGGDQEEFAGMDCCGAMCTAIAIAPTGFALLKSLVGNSSLVTLHAFPAGAPAELATPPPRVS